MGFSEIKRPGAEALGGGQMTGTFCDLNGDFAPDLLAVDPQRNVWVIFGEATEPRECQMTVETAGRIPLTVTVSFGKRPLGMWVVRPGEPTVISLPEAGKATLRWKSADGTAASRNVVVEAPTRVKL